VTADDAAVVADAPRGSRVPWDRVALPLFILGMGLVFGSLNPNFYSWTNVTNVARQSSVLALLAVGQTFAIVSGSTGRWTGWTTLSMPPR